MPRKSGFNPNRTCYLTADGKYYCYERWDDDAKCVVTQRLEVGKDLSLELTIMLDEFDHDMDLQDRYEGELRDPLFDAKVNSYKADPDNEDAVDPSLAAVRQHTVEFLTMAGFHSCQPLVGIDVDQLPTLML